ncbi:hypothetical protein Cgig2_023162 [Carnegiea gigantea]|uniref:X8 domain-containing protein n=1 Tax=Carnegiea gigantea TaxID=171969 RepID=A0A9Q1JYJ2_9CARY|nr:hypothetical protein Cgig2_023162 [Carnegiea gigantea]
MGTFLMEDCMPTWTNNTGHDGPMLRRAPHPRTQSANPTLTRVDTGLHMTTGSATYCVCKDGISDTLLQKTIDYACGSGADCRPILQNGPCFQPNTVKAHCDYAANSYFQNKGQAPGSCVTAGCTYPTSAGQGTSYSTGTTIGGTPGSTTTGIFSPTGLGPAGIDSTNPNGGSSLLKWAFDSILSGDKGCGVN